MSWVNWGETGENSLSHSMGLGEWEWRYADLECDFGDKEEKSFYVDRPYHTILWETGQEEWQESDRDFSPM